MATQDPYTNVNRYPANPYIVNQPEPNPNANVYPNAPQQGPAGGAESPWVFTPHAGGYWQAPGGGGGAGTGGPGWAEKMYSPDFLNSMKELYGLFGKNIGQTREDWMTNRPANLAEQYKAYMEKSPQLEQMEYNRALSRLKGQVGTAQENLMTLAGARRGGANSGMFSGGLEDLNRALLSGTGEIATQQAMQNLADQERRMNQYLGYQQGDITNQMGWLQGMTGAGQTALGQYGGWLGQMLPYEQFNIQFPQEMAVQRAGLGLQRAGMEEQINAARRAEAMGWLDRLMGWQGQQGNQYYTGQGQWGNYAGQRGAAGLGGYGAQWNPYA